MSESPSESPSVSLSPSASESPSVSLSESVSESPTVSLSESASISLSPSSSESASISPSQPPGSGLFSRESLNTLPNNKEDLNILYGEEDEEAVSKDDDIRVPVTGNDFYLAHQFRVINNSNKDVIRVKVNLQSTLAPTSSPVYLQIWNVTTSSWQTLDSDNTSPVNTDFDLVGVRSTNLDSYYDNDLEVAFRVYQENI